MILNNREYRFYVLHVDENNMAHIETGWEYRVHAVEFAREREPLPGHTYHVHSKNYLKSIGIDPDSNDSWTKYTLYKPNTKTTMPTLGKTTPAGRAKKRVAKLSTMAKKRLTRATATILKSYKKKAGKAIDSATKAVRKSAATKKKAKCATTRKKAKK